jgi:carbonic anhydrase
MPNPVASLRRGANVPVYGYVYDVRTGRLDEVKAATEVGRAAA